MKKVNFALILCWLWINVSSGEWPLSCQKNGVVIDDVCYEVNIGTATYINANLTCTKSGGMLAMMTNPIIQDNVIEKYRELETPIYGAIWAGIRTEPGSTVHRNLLINGTYFSDTFFKPWKPNTAFASLNQPNQCVVVSLENLWTHGPCTSSIDFACEFKRHKILCNVTEISISNARFDFCHTSTKIPGGEHLEVECYEDFVLIGPSNVTCMTDGAWSEMPQCVRGCLTPETPSNATFANTILEDKYLLGSEITYVCAAGYMTTVDLRQSHSKITCGYSGRWLPENSGCIRTERYKIQTVQVNVKNTIQLSCITEKKHVSGQISFLWLKDSKDINVKDSKNFIIASDGTLTVKNITKEAVGFYFCFQRAQSIIPATTGYELKLKPAFCENTVNRTEKLIYREGQSAVFHCPFTSQLTTFTWLKNGQRYHINSEQTLFPDGSLHTRQLQNSDQGIYTCETENKSSFCVHNHFIDVTVLVSAERICGKTAAGYLHPWVVSLWQKDEMSPFCYGIIMHESWILTSAQCLAMFHRKKKFDVSVHFQDGARSPTKQNNIESNFVHDIPVKVVKIHPKYSRRLSVNDIGLAQLATPIYFTETARPICLTDKDFSKREPCADSPPITGTVVGWGLLEKNEWEERFGASNESMTMVETEVACFGNADNSYYENMYCAKESEGSQLNEIEATLAGDAGSPFEISWKGRVYLLGIFSWGERALLLGERDYFTKIAPYVEWIKSVTVE